MTKYLCPDCGSLNVLVLDNGDSTVDVECDDCDTTNYTFLSDVPIYLESSN